MLLSIFIKNQALPYLLRGSPITKKCYDDLQCSPSRVVESIVLQMKTVVLRLVSLFACLRRELSIQRAATGLVSLLTAC